MKNCLINEYDILQCECGRTFLEIGELEEWTSLTNAIQKHMHTMHGEIRGRESTNTEKPPY